MLSFDAPSLRVVGQSYPSSLDLRFRITMVSKVKLDVSAFRTSQCLDFLLQTQTRSRLRLKSDIQNPSLWENFTHLSICCVTLWARSSVHVHVDLTFMSASNLMPDWESWANHPSSLSFRQQGSRRGKEPHIGRGKGIVLAWQIFSEAGFPTQRKTAPGGVPAL